MWTKTIPALIPICQTNPSDTVLLYPFLVFRMLDRINQFRRFYLLELQSQVHPWNSCSLCSFVVANGRPVVHVHP